MTIFVKMIGILYKNVRISLKNGSIFSRKPSLESSSSALSHPKRKGCALFSTCALIGMNTVEWRRRPHGCK